MAKQKITELVGQVLAPFFEETGYELFRTEFQKEGRDWFLRVFIEKKKDGRYEAITMDDCEAVSRFLSNRLDEMDPIEQNYYLEVSSPGMDRPLLTAEDFERFRGEPVEVYLYQGINGSKMITGKLLGLSDHTITLLDEKENKIEIATEKAAKTKLAVIF